MKVMSERLEPPVADGEPEVSGPPRVTGRQLRAEVVPVFVELEVAVPRLMSAVR